MGIAACAVALCSPLLPTATAAPTGEAGVFASAEPLAPVATPPSAVDSERFFYSTTTVGDAPTQASAAVYFPPGQPPAGGWPVLAWAHGTIGLGDQCAYSVAGPAEVGRDWAYLDSWLGQGYAIVAADYAGLGTDGEHPYLNGMVEAHNVVDAVRAATSHYDTLSRRWAVVGQSQGGGAAVFTARYATELGGPGLDYRGAVATGTPAYIEDALQLGGPGMPPIALGGDTTAYVLYILAGLRTSYPDLDIDSYLTDAGRAWVDRAESSCIGPFAEQLVAEHVVLGDVLARPISSLPDSHALLHNYLGLPESGYDRPLFLGQGLFDIDVVTPETLRFAATLTAAREPVTVRTYPTDHSGTVNMSLRDSIPFMQGLFA
uniref:lipase family protein n=1 Tax=Nocardia stercoris TaxID=2483361 RepID=UPI003898F517